MIELLKTIAAAGLLIEIIEKICKEKKSKHTERYVLDNGIEIIIKYE